VYVRESLSTRRLQVAETRNVDTVLTFCLYPSLPTRQYPSCHSLPCTDREMEDSVPESRALVCFGRSIDSALVHVQLG
jgi:hypothetical protein